MKDVIYDINKGINKPIEFRGLKAQYIWYLGGGLAVLLIGFAAMYLAGVPVFVNLPVIGIAGSGWFTVIYRCNHTYGEHGLMKAASFRQVPSAIFCRSRKILIRLNTKANEDDHDSSSDNIIQRGGGSAAAAQ